MRPKILLAIAAAISLAAPAAAQQSRCPTWEAGTRYPWQSTEIMAGDRFAWIRLEVDRRGYPIRCRVAKNNYPDAESRVWLCKQYYEEWRGPRAAASDAKVRTLERLSLIPSHRRALADRKARAAWFAQHPQERPKCYPEPSRPDRMDL
ncbi:MAG: hypothetical protein ABIS38_03180 [Sphingomicrobium sp.]